ncbi:MAG: hypothetical protein M3Z01_02755 [Thermoproteota archaeon]|nr:hypothetical protein [Thermoproteota archaeon]
MSDKTFVLITNTSVYTCSSPSISNYSNAMNSNSGTSDSNITWNSSFNNGIMVKFGGLNNSKIHNMCPFPNISIFNDCSLQSLNSQIDHNNCKLKRFENNKLNQSNFDKEGNLIADTKFKKQYSYEIKRSINSSSYSSDKIIVIIDLTKHIQNGLPDLNSPRLKILRENVTGMPDMTSAKNQEIIWVGNIKNYFTKPAGDYNNETYVVLQFNTGRHIDEKNSTSNTIGKKSFGILFDISNSSNPNLLEYRGDGAVYTKYKYDLIKQLAGKDFVFYSLNDKGSPHFINDLLNKNKVKLEVKTFLTKDNKRVIETFIDNGSGKVVPYWILKDLSKLKDDESILDKDAFTKVTTQGSGYVISRTDNIDTRPVSFESYIINN